MILIGNTGVGKTTMAEILSGTEIQVLKKPNTGIYEFKGQRGKSGAKSDTRIPNFFRNGEEVFIDCPGFEDTNIDQDITNAFFIE